MKKITLHSTEYQIGRLDLFQSLNVARLVAPILPVIFNDALGAIAQAIVASKEEGEASIEDKLGEVVNLMAISEPVLKCIAEMKQADFDTVVRSCLGAVERHNGKTWAPVMQNGVCMFDDIDSGTALVLVFHVLWSELRPTISALKL